MTASRTNSEHTGLRQAPPQRILFQPDTRPSRHTNNSTNSPQPSSNMSGITYSASSNPQSMSFTIANYEPRPQMPLTLRPVVTPGNNPGLFPREGGRTGRGATNFKGLMLPGSKL